MSFYRRETIHISLGSTANAISAHVLNLQGLAATSPSPTTTATASTSTLCDPHVTHAVQEQLHVPRVLIVDEARHFQPQAVQSTTSTNTNVPAATDTTTTPHAVIVPTWEGKVQVVHPYQYQQNPPDTRTNNNNNNASLSFHEAASTLAYSAHSRYRADSLPSPYTSVANSNNRHMNWDDGDDEEEEEDDDDKRYRQRRQERQENHWHTAIKAPLEQQMDQYWQDQEGTSSVISEQQQQPPPSPLLLSWRDYWMPPYPLPSSFQAPLPYTSQPGGIVDTWDSFANGYYGSSSSSSGGGGGDNLSHWKEEYLLDRLRLLLESCDAVQGFNIYTEGWGIYAGLTTALLQEMQEESRTAGRFVIHAAEPHCPSEQEDNSSSNSSNEKENNNDQPPASSLQATPAWQPANVQRVRRNMQTGLALHGFATNAHAVLPLSLNHNSSNGKTTTKTLFEQSATLAVALEAATLSYRLSGVSGGNGSSRSSASQPSTCSSKIGLNGYYDGMGRSSWKDSYGTSDRLSFGEFLACLTPSNQHPLLELDAAFGNKDSGELSLMQRLDIGTSIERERLLLQQQSGRRDARARGRPREVLPGAWMLNAGAYTTDGRDGGSGILTSLSPQRNTPTQAGNDRQLHTHFSLSTSLRTTVGSSSSSSSTNTVSDPLTLLMEGMGIRYRPGVSMGTVVNQSVTSLTRGGYGAGSYWKRFVQADSPVLSVLGNTTRSYTYLYDISATMKESLSRKYVGYHSRDISSGVLPEAEDCSEALDYCFDTRDVYQPPNGSGLVVDAEGAYFDTE